MKRISSILLACFILFMGMHVTFATHFCGGEVAAMKLSFNSEIASCGMEKSTHDCKSNNQITSNCCKNNIVSYSVDNNYVSSIFEFKNISKDITNYLFCNSVAYFDFSKKIQNISIEESPPLNVLINKVCLSKICTYRI